MKIWKMSGAGNDFVLITGKARGAAELRRLARRLCDRRRAVGADGLLHVRRAGPGLIALRYFNSDGSEAFCGNGARCAALWAFRRGLAPRRMTLSTPRGRLAAEVRARGIVRMAMPEVRGISLRHKGKYPSGVREVHFLDTGAPHAVVPVGGIERLDARRLGAELRRNPAFGRAGANVNFVEKRGGVFFVRTYERGVEDETPACGTGLAACAAALAADGRAASPVRLRARGGEDFIVRLKSSSAGASEITVEGPARLVFSGEI